MLGAAGATGLARVEVDAKAGLADAEIGVVELAEVEDVRGEEAEDDVAEQVLLARGFSNQIASAAGLRGGLPTNVSAASSARRS
ncbi:hypothetical protein ACSRUE_19480 [Sorangium sp. KYC3313]|uniref:hypothetical protein n=1 Tax=Sorangium sp. KYC3313 TaxID=3449740 RepID=UPI003F8B5122